MSNPLKDIKHDSLVKVFQAALERRNTSRTVLSEDTGLSFVTAGKIADALIESHILRQTRTTKCAILKRRSRLICTKQRYWIGVVILLPEKFIFKILDLSLRCKNELIYRPDKTVFIDDVMESFFKKVDIFVKQNVNMAYCCSLGILVRGTYSESEDKVYTREIPHLGALRMKKTFSRISYGNVPFVMPLYSAFALELRRTLGDDQRIYTLFMDKNNLKSTYINKFSGNKVDIKDWESLHINKYLTIARLIRSTPSPEPFFTPIVDNLTAVVRTLPVTDIVVTGNLYTYMDAVIRYLRQSINANLCDENTHTPNIKHIDLISTATSYISRVIRDQWFEAFILKDELP